MKYLSLIFITLFIFTSCGPQAAPRDLPVIDFKGIETTSGLKYQVIEEGSGAKPTANDTVTVHYEGSLTDGSVFDSSYKRGKALSFPLNGVIKGWTEGLQLMKVGAKYKFCIPPALGYGSRGAGRSIPPDATLIFIVELISISK